MGLLATKGAPLARSSDASTLSYGILNRMNITALCNRVITIAFYLLLALVPLLLTPWNYELFEYNKMMATYALTVVILTSWLTKMAAEKEIRIAKTPLDMPIGLFVLSQLVSSIFSIDPHVSWFGYYSRFNGGMWSIISYILLYYAFVTHFGIFEHHKDGAKKEESNVLHRLLTSSLVSAIIVALYAVAERFGIDKHLWVQDVQNRVFSTLGQPNWLAAYLVALTPIAWAFALKKKTFTQKNILSWDYLWTAVSALFFLVLLFTRSRSGLVGLLVADVIFCATILWKTGKNVSLKASLFLIHGIVVGIIFLNGSNVGTIDRYFSLRGLSNLITHKAPATTPAPVVAPLLETGGTESGTIRKYVWQGAIEAWKSTTKTMFVGTGTETFAFAFYQFRPLGHNLTSEWDFLYNKAHNEYLNYLATTGLLGLGAYLAVLLTFFIWVVRQKESKDVVVAALFAGWVSILITNFFGFSVVIVQLFLFLFPALIYVLVTRSRSEHIASYTFKTVFPSWSWWAIVGLGVIFLARIGSLWYADTLFASGYRFDRSGHYAQAVDKIEQAIALNPTEPVYRDEIAAPLISLAVTAMEQQNATMASDLVRRALSQSDRAIQISPKNANFWKTRTKVYYSLSGADSEFNDAAIVALTHARDLSPNDPKIYYNLAILEGRGGNVEKAIGHLRKAIDLKKNYRDAYYGLYVFYTDLKKPKEALDVLTQYLTDVDPNDQAFKELIEKRP